MHTNAQGHRPTPQEARSGGEVKRRGGYAGPPPSRARHSSAPPAAHLPNTSPKGRARAAGGARAPPNAGAAGPSAARRAACAAPRSTRLDAAHVGLRRALAEDCMLTSVMVEEGTGWPPRRRS